MMRIEVMGYRATKLKKRVLNAQHRQYHIKLAAEMRASAERSLEATKQFITDNVPEELHDAAMVETMKSYNDLLLEAIAEENRTCMEGQH